MTRANTSQSMRVLRAIEKHQPVSGMKIAYLVNEPVPSVYSQIGTLMQQGKVRRYKSCLRDTEFSAKPLVHYCLASLPVTVAETAGKPAPKCRGPALHEPLATKRRSRAAKVSGVIAGACISRQYALWGGRGHV